jgi:hypothetical protein
MFDKQACASYEVQKVVALLLFIVTTRIIEGGKPRQL